MSKFRFIGADKSMGYRKGKIYRGSVQYRAEGVLFFPGVFPFNLGKIIIPYSSEKLLRQNWEQL